MDERKERNLADTRAKAAKRAKESEVEKERRKSVKAKQTAAKRIAESAEEKKERNSVKAKQTASKRAEESEEEKMDRNSVKAKQTATKRAADSEETKKERNSVKAEHTADKRAAETEVEKKKRNAAKAVAGAEMRRSQTEDEARKRREKDKLQRAMKRANQIPSSQYAGKNAQKVLVGEQIVPELKDTEDTIGEMNIICKFCDARKWKKETPTLCCNSGKVILDAFPDPPSLLQELLTKDSDDGNLFRKNTRTFNNALTLSSLQVRIKRFDNGFTPSVIFEGKVCQRIGPLFPEEGEEPKFAQLYVHDPSTEQTKRVENMNLPTNMTEKDVRITKNILLKLQQMLKDINPYVKDILHICEIPDQELSVGKLIISCKERPKGSHERQYNLQQSFSEVSVLTNSVPGDMVLQKRGGGLQKIFDIHPSAQPLHFVLLFPFGTKGYDVEAKHLGKAKRVSPREFFSYHLNMRCLASDFLFRFGRLFQEYVCLAFTTMESQRLKFQQNNQSALRADSYKNVKEAVAGCVPLTDKVSSDDHNLKIGKRIVLSSSYVGSPRWYNSKFQDGMAICRKFRKPDLFITFTCNQRWEEITRELRKGEIVQDRPDLVSRVFKLKKDQLMKDIKSGNIFGKVPAFLWVIEFQKRGLPHVHILVILAEEDRLSTSSDVDDVISAQLPPDPSLFKPGSKEKKQAERLEAIVLKNMIHGPCGKLNPKSPCMVDGKCSKGYPKAFCTKTVINSAKTYPEYQRLDPENGGRKITVGNYEIDNSWVVPHSPFILLRFDNHANVEICMTFLAPKYLFKYITKGEDRAMVRAEVLQEGEAIAKDEIEEYVDLRSVGSSEASWHLFNFTISKNKPAVYALRVHLKDEQQVVYDMGAEEQCLETQRWTELTGFFQFNADHPETMISYVDFPESLTWNASEKHWKLRKNASDTIGRIHSVHPVAGEVYYLRMLLHHEHSKGKISFEHLKTVDGVDKESYQEVCRTLGLLQDDQEWDEALAEGSLTRMSSTLRELFVTIVLFCMPANPKELFDKHYLEWSDDFKFKALKKNVVLSESQIRTLVLIDIKQRLQSWDRDINIINIPQPTQQELDEVAFTNKSSLPVVIQEELDFDIDSLKASLEEKKIKFTESQKKVFDRVMKAVDDQTPLCLFVDARGGTGKTYVLNAVLASVRIIEGGSVALAVGSTGIAANLLHLGRTLHSRFKVPLNITSESICNINAQSTLAEMIRMAKVIVWDEAPMNHRYQLEALDRTLQDVTGNDDPFGGKIIVLSGDFRQCLPVLPNANRAQVVDAALNRSTLWKFFTVMQLTENMRVQLSLDPDTAGFDEFTLKLGNGEMEVIADTDLVQIPDEMCLKIESNTLKESPS